MQTIRIIAAVVDTTQLVMYKADGSTIIIPQGDPRIRPLVEKVIPALKRTGYADLTEEEISKKPAFEDCYTHYAEAEKKMGDVVKFFRMAKAKLKELLDKPVAPVEPTHGVVGSLPAMEPAKKGQGGDALMSKDMDAVREIMAHAAPSHAPEFIAEAKNTETTVVAVMEDGTIIPGMEQLDLQLRDIAGKLGNPTGIMKFFERLATVERRHSVSDLLKFMEKGELPIADDGTVLVYKRLKSTQEQGVFVDCHSGRVKQRVGSHVFMAETLVDPDRRVECSSGLHVARRDYLSSFNGNVCVLAKLAPEDVIAVPHGDPRKLRAKGYFIIAELSQKDHDNVTQNRKLTDTNLLGNAVAGNHTPVIETVEITQGHGGGVIITPKNQVVAPERDLALDKKPLRTAEDAEEEYSSVDARTVAIDLGKPDGDKTVAVTLEGNTVVDVEVIEPVKETPAPVEKFTATPAVTLSKVQQLKADFVNATTIPSKHTAALALMAHKKATKKGWAKLGISDVLANEILESASAKVTPKEVIKAKPAPAKKKAKPAKLDPVTAELKKELARVAAAETPKANGPTTKAQAAKALWDHAMTGDAKAAEQLLTFKKVAKKGWVVLGLPANATEQLTAILNKK